MPQLVQTNTAINLNAFTPQRVASYKNQLSLPIVNQVLWTEPAHLPTNLPNVTLYQLTTYVWLTMGCGGSTPPVVGPVTVTFDDGTGPTSVVIGFIPRSPLNGDDQNAAPMVNDFPNNIAAAFAGQICFPLAGGASVTFSCPFICHAAMQGQYAIVVVLNQL